MGNRTLEEKKNSRGEVEESNSYVYNESNQLSEATLCSGRTTRKVCYTYDDDGSLIKEYSPTDNSTTTYQYTVENRLEAVYTGSAYNRTLQMAAAYDGDGNRVYQVNYNPDKDEDFSCYYRSYNNCDYNGTGIQLKVDGEVSPTEEELIGLIAPAGATLTSKYELIEYVNDVNRQYVEVLVEQNINGRTDTTYTYGVDRISKELFNQTAKTSYYLYDPRGSVAGLADAEEHLTKTYRYSVTGEVTYGSAAYENEYTYNGESYNPNIHSQYLRARYYCVVTANFLTEDSYLGNINEPLTLNRYNYCISSYLNYWDPSGNVSLSGLVIPSIVSSLWENVKNVTWDDLKQTGQKIKDKAISLKGTINSFGNGVLGSVAKAVVDKPAVSLMPWALLVDNLHNTIQDLMQPSPLVRDTAISYRKWNFTGVLKDYISMTEIPIKALAGDVEDMNAYYIGRCTGDVVIFGLGMWEAFEGASIAGSGGAAMALETASGGGIIAAPATVAVTIGGIIIWIDGTMEAAYSFEMFRQDVGKYQDNKRKENTSESEDEEAKTNERVYKPNDGKHKGSARGDISADPFWNNPEAAQESLNKAYSSNSTKQLYNVYKGKIVKFQPDNTGAWHAYEVINPASEVPADVLRNMRNDGLITNAQYMKWIKGKLR